MRYRYIVDQPVFIMQPPKGPLAAYVQPFCVWAFEQGYERHSVRRKINAATGFSDWLQRKHISVGDVRWEHSAQYLRHLCGNKPLCKGNRLSLKQFMDFLGHRGAISLDKPSLGCATPVERYVRKFKTYLEDQRGLVPTTVSQYTFYVRLFLRKRFGNNPVALGALRADDIAGFLQQESSSTHFARPKTIASSLRGNASVLQRGPAPAIWH